MMRGTVGSRQRRAGVIQEDMQSSVAVSALCHPGGDTGATVMSHGLVMDHRADLNRSPETPERKG